MYTARERVEVPLIMLDLVCEQPTPFLGVVGYGCGVSEVNEAFQALACFRENKCSLAELHRQLVSLKSENARVHTVGRERRELLGVPDGIFQVSRTSRGLRALYKPHGTCFDDSPFLRYLRRRQRVVRRCRELCR